MAALLVVEADLAHVCLDLLLAEQSAVEVGD